MTMYTDLTAIFALLITIALTGLAVTVLATRTVPPAKPILYSLLIVLVGLGPYPVASNNFIAWPAFVAAYIAGLKYRRLYKPLTLTILALEFLCILSTLTRPWWFISPGMYGAAALMSFGMAPWPISLVAVLLTGSRSAWVGLAGAGAVWLRRWWIWLLVAALAIGCIFIRVDTVNYRLIVWKEGFEYFLRSPWFGYGTGTYEALGPRFQAGTTHADNLLLTLLIEYGIIGTIPFACLGTEIVKMLKSNRSPLAFGLVAVLIMQVLDASLMFPTTGMIFGLALAKTQEG